MPKLHDLAWEGNLQELAKVVPGPHFDHLDATGRSVLYCACRSARVSPEVVRLLIDEKCCSVNIRNGPACMGSTAPHAVVESLCAVVDSMQSTEEDLQLVQRLLCVLQLLKSRRADMNVPNAQDMTALQEFLKFGVQMSSCSMFASLVNDFNEALCSSQPLGSAATAIPLNSQSISAILPPERSSLAHAYPPPPPASAPPPSPPHSPIGAHVLPPPAHLYSLPPAAFPISSSRPNDDAVPHPQSSQPVPFAGSGIYDMGFQPELVSQAIQQSDGNEQAAIETILNTLRTNLPQAAHAAADAAADDVAAIAIIDPASSAALARVEPAPEPPLPASYSEYTLELTAEDYNALMLQCVADPPGTCNAVVACCHRLPSSIQKDVRHGSRLLAMSLFNSNRNLIYEFREMNIPLGQLRTIATVYSDCQSVRIKFMCCTIPGFVPFNVPDSFSQCCMAFGCKEPLRKGGRHHCRCCGMLFCSICSDFKIAHPISGKLRVCKTCHAAFSSNPGNMWRSDWVISKRNETFCATCERLTTALDLIEKMPHAAQLGLDVTRLWSGDDAEYKRQLRLLQRSHPDANMGRENSSSTDFGQLQASCAKLLDRLAAKELRYQSQFASSSQALAIVERACFKCHMVFSLLWSKHHCRVCGLAVCSACCSPQNIVLPCNFGFGSKAVRVCALCCATLLANLAPSSTSLVSSVPGSVVSQQNCAQTHPRILWRDGGYDLFQSTSNARPQPPLPCLSQLQVACKVDALNAQTARLTLYFCPGLAQDVAIVKEHLGVLQMSVTRPFSAFESLWKCLLNQGYPPSIIPELNSVGVADCDCFMNAVFQHKRLRNSSLIPLFCACSDEWGEELHRVLMRVSQGTETTLSVDATIKNSPPTLPWSAVQQLIQVLRSHGIFSLWAPLAIKFFSLSDFLDSTKIVMQKLQERTAMLRARLARFAERIERHKMFCSMIRENTEALEAFIGRSCYRLSRERIRLEAQKSSSHPVLTLRQEDRSERQSDFLKFEVISSNISEEYALYRARKQMAQDDRAENLLIQEISSKVRADQPSSNRHVEWVFDALSSCNIGFDSIALLQAIKNEEEELAENRSVFRTQLHAESQDLVDENQNLQAEIDDLCDEEKECGAMLLMSTLNEHVARLRSSSTLELEECDNEVRVRSEKERRLTEQIDAMGRRLQVCECAQKQRVDARDELEFKLKLLSEKIKDVVGQLITQVPLLQQARGHCCDIEKALRLLIDTQSRGESFCLVLQSVHQTMGLEVTKISCVRDNVSTILALRGALFDESSAILTQARQISESQEDSSWFQPDRFSIEAFSFEISPEDSVLAALNNKNNENLSRLSALQAAFKNVEPNMMQRFSQLVLSFEAELQFLNLDPATTVYSEFQALTDSAALLEPLFQHESQVIATFSNERYGRRIQDILSKSDSIMNQIADRERDHKKRILSLQQLRADYDGMAADADNVFNMFQAHIKRVNVDIEDIQASIQRCFDNPQSISIIQRIPFGLDCMVSDTRSKNFRRSIEQHRQMLQAKVDQKLMRPQSFFLNSSQSRSATLDDLKSVALGAIGDAQQLLERYLNELQQPLEHPLKASPEFTDWLRLRVDNLMEFHRQINQKLDSVYKIVQNDPSFSETSELELLIKSDEQLKPVMARLYQQFQDICLRESTEQDLRNDLKTVWENHSSARRLDINVKFIRLRPTAPLMLMPPSAADGPAIYASPPSWNTPNSYFISLPNLPAAEQLKRNKSGGSEEPPDDMIDQTFNMEIYRDPVVASDGFTYERSSILDWFRTHNTSPKTGEVLQNTTLVPNHDLRARVLAWQEQRLVRK